MKKLITLILVLMITTISSAGFADSVQNSRPGGIYHPDGSYQFSEQEVAHLNAWSAQDVHDRNSMLDMLKTVVPHYVKQLDAAEKKIFSQAMLHKSKDFTIISNHEIMLTGYSYIQGCWTELTKYGKALLVKTHSGNGSTLYKELYAVVELWRDSYPSGRVAYSVNGKNNVKEVTASLLSEPSSGTYHGEGYHMIPYYCPVTGDCNLNTYYSRTSAMSYVHPY